MNYYVIYWAKSHLPTLGYIVSGVRFLGYDGVPGPILILDNQTVPIVSGDRNTTPIPSVISVAREFGKGNDIITWTSWEPYSNMRTWVLKPGDGLKYVHVGFRDNAESCLKCIMLLSC